MSAVRQRKKEASAQGEKIIKELKQKKNKKVAEKWTIPIQYILPSAFLFAVVTSCTLAYFLLPPRINAVKFDLGEPMPLQGSLAPNDRLTKAEILLENQVYGPESIAIHPETGLIYTGLKTGLIMEIDLMIDKPRILKAVKLVTFDECDGSYKMAPKCGRPLGMRFNEFGELLVADGYLGLYMINFEKEKTLKILGAGELPENDETAPPLRYINDFDFLPDGRIIISESSTKFDDRDCLLDMMEHRPNGRLLIFDPHKKSLRVLQNDLYFPNGVQVSIEKGAPKDAPMRVFYSEMGMARIMTIWVPRDPYSQKLIKMKPLIENLPGYPDNIRLTNKGHLLVPLPSQRTSDDRWIESMSGVRELFTKIVTPQALNWFSGWITTNKGLVLKVDIETGQVIDSYSDGTSKVNEISIAVDDGNGNLILGSDANYYIARVKI